VSSRRVGIALACLLHPGTDGPLAGLVGGHLVCLLTGRRPEPTLRSHRPWPGTHRRPRGGAPLPPEADGVGVDDGGAARGGAVGQGYASVRGTSTVRVCL